MILCVRVCVCVCVFVCVYVCKIDEKRDCYIKDNVWKVFQNVILKSVSFFYIPFLSFGQ